jgi:hypothetical protein
MHMLRLTALLLATLLTMAGCGAPPAPAGDIILTNSGCTSSAFFLPNTREPQITLANQADVPMVFSIPRMDRWQVLGPGTRATFDLPRYSMGSFDFFCLSESEHTKAGGGNPLLCALEPKDLAAVARSRGTFEIEHHERIREVLGPKP